MYICKAVHALRKVVGTHNLYALEIQGAQQVCLVQTNFLLTQRAQVRHQTPLGSARIQP